MDQLKLKSLLESLINEIEENNSLTLDEIITKLSLEMQSQLLVKELNS